MINLHEKNEQLQQLVTVTEQTDQIVVLEQQDSLTELILAKFFNLQSSVLSYQSSM